MERNKNINYLLTVISCSLLSLCTIGIVVNCMGLFIEPIKNYYNVSNGSVSLIITLINVSFGLASPFITPVLKKYKLRHVMSLAVLTCLIALVLFSVNKIFIMYYPLAVIYGTSACFFSIVTYSIVLNNWFDKGFATISSLVICFAGIGGVVFSKLINYQIVNSGFKFAFIFIAVIIALCTVLPILFLHIKPEEVGLAKITDENKKVSSRACRTDMSIVKLSILFIAIVSIVRGFSPIVSSFGVSKGLSSNEAATLVSLVMISNIIFKPLMGILAEKTNAYLTNFIYMIAIVLSYQLFRISNSWPMFIASSMAFGTIYASTTVGIQLILKDNTTQEDFGKYYAIINLTNYVMFAIGIYLVGISLDIFGSYIPTMNILSLIASLNIAVLLIITIKKHKGEKNGIKAKIM